MQVCTSSQTAMPTSHHSVFYRPDALPDAQPTASKHWRYIKVSLIHEYVNFPTTYPQIFPTPSCPLEFYQYKVRSYLTSYTLSSIDWYHDSYLDTCRSTAVETQTRAAEQGPGQRQPAEMHSLSHTINQRLFYVCSIVIICYFMSINQSMWNLYGAAIWHIQECQQ